MDAQPAQFRWHKPWTWPLPRWAHVLLVTCVVLLTIAGLYELSRRATLYGGQVVEKRAEQIPVGIVLKNTPDWLAPEILNSIREETEKFVRRDADTFRRFQNPLDQDILRQVAENYTGLDNGVERQTLANNAWIKSVPHVRRRVQEDRRAQWIEVYAIYRKPAAVIAVPFDNAGKRVTDLKACKDPARAGTLRFYLMDIEQTRLPGEYDKNAFGGGLLTLFGIDEDVPAPGAAWTAPEVGAGLRLAANLTGQPYASQVALINLWNYQARGVELGAADRLDPHLTLLTSAGSQVRWGRAIGEEKFYEVHASAKLKALAQIFARYNRLDAGREYVDIRYEQVKVPAPVRTAREADTPRRPRRDRRI